jgi:hypothetical protein
MADLRIYDRYCHALQIAGADLKGSAVPFIPANLYF